MHAFYRALLAQRYLALALLIALTAWLASPLLTPSRLLVDFSLDSLLVPDAAAKAELAALHDDFGDDLDLVAVLVRVPPPHTIADPATFEVLAAVARHLAAAPEIDAARVVSSLDLPLLHTASGEIQPRALALAAPADRLAVARALSTHTSYRDLLLAHDLHAALVVAPFATTAPDARNAMLAGLDAALAPLATRLPDGGELLPVGVPLVQATYTRTALHDIVVLVPLTLVIIAALLGLAFRRAYAVFGPLTGVGVSTLWTLGLIQHLGLPFDMVNSVAGVVTLVVGVAAGAHVVSRHREELARLSAGGDPTPHRRAAIIAAMVRMTPACFVTSATTAVGFGSLASATLPAIANFGLVLAAGVMMSFAVQMLWLPIQLSFIRPARIAPAPARGPHAGETLFSRLLDKTAAFVLTHAHKTLVLTAVLAALAAWFARDLHADARMAGELAPDHPVAHALFSMERDLSGVLVHAVVIRGNPTSACQADADCPTNHRCRRVDPYFLTTRRLVDAQTALTGLPADPALLSLEDRLRPAASLFEDAPTLSGRCAPSVTAAPVVAFLADLSAFLAADTHRALVSNVQTFLNLVNDLGPSPTPLDPSVVAERLSLLESGAPELVARLVTPDHTRTQLVLRANDIGLAAWRNFRPELERELARLVTVHGLSSYDVHVTGGSTLAERAISGLADDLASSLGWSFLLIALFMIGLVKSIRLGLLALIPNVLPLLYTFGLMGAFDFPIRASTLIVFSVAFGIAVDDTIHFIHRYREEAARRGEGREALADTVIATGHPIVLTSVILVCGLMMNAFSDFMAIVEFGVLSAVTLLIALVVDLTVTPALLLVLRGRLGLPLPPPTRPAAEGR